MTRSTNPAATAVFFRPLAEAEAIRPFRAHVPESELEDLRRRIVATRLPERETVGDSSQGVPLATIRKLARYWASEYDWRRVEARLNAYPQFLTEIDGLDIHFLHVRSRHANSLPLLVLHGWPGTVIEHLKTIDLLTDPTAHGGSAAEAFDLVIPSMPGFGFSGKPSTTGWGPARIARAWAELMRRLGYTRYVAQGGDWGGITVDVMATQGHPELIGIHTNMPGTVPPEIDAALRARRPPPAGLSPDEKRAYESLAFTYANVVQYASYMASRPQTLYGLADSPVGLAAWLHDPLTLGLVTRAFDGHPTSLTRDDLLDNVTLFWLTNTAVSAARLYRENEIGYFTPKGVTLPVAVSVFPEELYQAPRSWTERAYPDLIHYGRLDAGGHFAAWEQPELFTRELRAAFRSLRNDLA